MVAHWIFGFILLALPFWWGEATELQIAETTPLAELTGTDSAQNPILAPDGSAVAWADGDGMCVYRFDNDETSCTPWADNARLNSDRLNLAVWSPDSRQIILHEDFFIRLCDSDIWSFDVESSTFTNLTDDGYYGGLLNTDEGAQINVDFAPTFEPNTGDLYFLRLSTAEESFSIGASILTLMKLNADGDVEEVRMMSADLPGPTAIYRPGRFSEDGNTLYLNVLPPDWNQNAASGIYALDLSADTFTPLATVPDLQAALPEWAREGYAPADVEPAAGGLVIWMENGSGDFNFVYRTPVFLDSATGEATTLIDYSSFDTPAASLQTREGDDILAFNQPLRGIVMPGGETYWLMASKQGGGMAVFEVALPPSADAEPELLTLVDHSMRPRLDAPPTLSEDFKLLMGDVLFTLEEAAE
jgi:hypothetical protein